jgi:hypothetical protein
MKSDFREVSIQVKCVGPHCPFLFKGGNPQDLALYRTRVFGCPGEYFTSLVLSKKVCKVIEGRPSRICNHHCSNSLGQSAGDKSLQRIHHGIPKADVCADKQIRIFELFRRQLLESYVHGLNPDVVDEGVKLKVGENFRIDVYAGNNGVMPLCTIDSCQSPSAPYLHDVRAFCEAKTAEEIHEQPTGVPDPEAEPGGSVKALQPLYFHMTRLISTHPV